MNKLDDAVQKIKDFAVLSAILITGLALPFIGDVLATIQLGKSLLYLNFNYFEFIVLMGALNLVPVILCLLCYKGGTDLKGYRYVPIFVTYLFVIHCHYDAILNWEGPFAGLVIIVAPILGTLIFAVVFFIVCFLAWHFGIIDRNCSEMSLSSENPHNENEDSEHETTKQ